MSIARPVLLWLILSAPILLLFDRPITYAVLATATAAALAVVALTVRSGEAGHLSEIVRPITLLTALPACWILIQVAPLKALGLAHPIWESAEAALGHPIASRISIDLGASLIALGRYLSTVALVILAAAVAVDRQKAEWVLFALMTATALVAIVLIGHDLMGLTNLGASTGLNGRAEARNCTALGVIIAVSAGLRTFERRETARLNPSRSASPPVFNITFLACAGALTICLAALALNYSANAIFSVAYGLALLSTIFLVRRLGLGPIAFSAIVLTGAIIALVVVAAQARVATTGVTLAFASQAPQSLIAITQRIVADAPWAGTGAGTFGAMLPIYQSIDEVTEGSAAPTAAAAIAVELGRLLLGAIVILTMAGMIILLRGALQRGRDSFYPAAGASCLLVLSLEAFGDAGAFGPAVSVIAAAMTGLAIVQRKSRTLP